MKTTMTIHRALSELKLIDSRIEKGIADINPVGYRKKDKPVNNMYVKADFDDDATRKLQSITDLIERKTKIKSAIVKANGITIVEIGEKKMTIADAINFKTIIVFKKHLISSLLNKFNSVMGAVNIENDKVQANALKLAEAALQKDNVKIGDDDALAITEPFINKNEFHLVDPLGVEKLTEEMERDLAEFETEVDAVLSEINAVTIIEI